MTIYKFSKKQNKIHRRLSSFQVIVISFLSLIMLGTLLLMLPLSTRNGNGATFQDAIFTSTSAVCVTGLVVRDTATYWSGFGQAVILSLIQIGGMGVVTVALSITVISGKKIGLMQRSTMQEAIAAPKIGGIVRLTNFILKTTIALELIGALILFPTFYQKLGFFKGLWYSIFHSISAFCNAGFDLNGNFSSLTAYDSNASVNFTVMGLVIAGGIGFITWADIKKNRWHFKKYSMQSKVILITTLVLIILPTIYFYMFEFSDMKFSERILCSLFQSVSPRTAGFNTTNLTAFSEIGLMITIILMLIGGSPGGTAGGMKTTTITVLLASALSVFRKNEHTHFFKRRIPENTIKNASTILLMYLTTSMLGAMIIRHVEKIPLMSSLFETASAIGTVGLSLGITTELGTLSRAILIFLMFIGRAGGLTLIFAAVSEKKLDGARFPQEKITVG